MPKQQQVPNSFTTSSTEDASKMLALLLANDYECSISLDCEGVYMIFYGQPQYGGCRLEWIDPDSEYVAQYDEEDD